MNESKDRNEFLSLAEAVGGIFKVKFDITKLVGIEGERRIALVDKIFSSLIKWLFTTCTSLAFYVRKDIEVYDDRVDLVLEIRYSVPRIDVEKKRKEATEEVEELQASQHA